MRHLIAFALIGLGTGSARSVWRKGQWRAATVSLGVIGSLVASELVERGLSHGHGK